MVIKCYRRPWKKEALFTRFYLQVRPVANGYNLTDDEPVLWSSADWHMAWIKKIQVTML